MGFGAVITSGETNTLLSDRLLDCVTEVRIEQSLDDQTRFAVRFEEDVSGGQPVTSRADELRCERMMAIAVQGRDGLACLVRGPITNVRSSATLGGPGSWFEVHGQDRRVELDRECRRRAWSGRASAAAANILNAGFRTEIEETRIIYGSTRAGGDQVTQTLNQRSTDLAFIRQIARQNNLHFWIAYTCRLNGAPTARSMTVTETATLAASPPRRQGGPTGIDQIALVPTVPLTLRVHVPQEQCPNVTAFDLEMNPERPNTYAGTAIDDRDLEEHRTSVTDPQPTITRSGQRMAGCQARRDVCLTTAGNPEQIHARAESVLTEAGWFVEATASTTAHMLGGILQPHDVVGVQGLGTMDSGPYQVSAVTHVINATAHYMDISLRRNAIGEGD